PTPAPSPACPGHNPPCPPRRSCARHETPRYPYARPPPGSPATPDDPQAATPAYPAGTKTADSGPPDGTPSPSTDPVKRSPPGPVRHAGPGQLILQQPVERAGNPLKAW